MPPPGPPSPPRSPMFATMDRQVARLAGAATEAAVLESTMLLAAHGLDLFYTRVMPSRQAGLTRSTTNGLLPVFRSSCNASHVPG